MIQSKEQRLVFCFSRVSAFGIVLQDNDCNKQSVSSKSYTNYDNSVYLPGLYFSKPTKKRAKEKFLELWSFSITLVTHFR